ncbi:MAG TPA: hypothetical protein VGE76_15855 [Opitutaceae bacterium]
MYDTIYVHGGFRRPVDNDISVTREAANVRAQIGPPIAGERLGAKLFDAIMQS